MMHFSQYLLLTLTFITLTLAAPYSYHNSTSEIDAPAITVKAITGKFTCETTTGSPKIADIQKILENLEKINRGIEFPQSNLSGSKCAEVHKAEGTAITHLCGRINFTMSCGDAIDITKRIIEECAWNGLAGGKFEFSNTPLTYTVSHS